MINIVIIHARKDEREKISSCVELQEEINVLGYGKDGYDALKMVSSLKPDIALVDNNLEYIEGTEVPPLIRLRSPATAVVLLTAKIDNYQLYRAAVNEVAGFVYMKTDLDFLPEIIKSVSRGECFISSGLAARILQIISDEAKGSQKNNQKNYMGAKFRAPEDPIGFLSKMELQIMAYIGEGYNSTGIARELNLSAGTVRNYISALMTKTGLKNRPQMVRYALDYGLISP